MVHFNVKLIYSGEAPKLFSAMLRCKSPFHTETQDYALPKAISIAYWP